MTNNERFNAMLNSCLHPRAVYNALYALAPAIRGARSTLYNALYALAPLIRETRSTFPESFVGKTDWEIISKISAVNRQSETEVEAPDGD